jgi:hypothetical protein
MNVRTLGLGIGAVCATLLVGWGLSSLVSGNGAPAQRATMAGAPTTVGLGSSSARVEPRRRASKRARVRQVNNTPMVEAESPSLASRRGNPRLP